VDQLSPPLGSKEARTEVPLTTHSIIHIVLPIFHSRCGLAH
jgi:predicted nucleotidyltransferase